MHVRNVSIQRRLRIFTAKMAVFGVETYQQAVAMYLRWYVKRAFNSKYPAPNEKQKKTRECLFAALHLISKRQTHLIFSQDAHTIETVLNTAFMIRHYESTESNPPISEFMGPTTDICLLFLDNNVFDVEKIYETRARFAKTTIDGIPVLKRDFSQQTAYIAHWYVSHTTRLARQQRVGPASRRMTRAIERICAVWMEQIFAIEDFKVLSQQRVTLSRTSTGRAKLDSERSILKRRFGRIRSDSVTTTRELLSANRNLSKSLLSTREIRNMEDELEQARIRMD
ncbi:hypothetical protein CC80DRAFT_532885 [Byssothecium circinans]|uniref:Uncharacterized protein n=1 Tax=Byssothecium circinans TaxID=147558 RepID=A0A6A5U7Z3_9PLEO|nr:hypothetical protein CC80DRAFT_532885 [Byssothecium circinans]